MSHDGIRAFLKESQLIRMVIAVIVLGWTLNILAGLGKDDIALIAIFSGIAGSAATFLFAPATGK